MRKNHVGFAMIGIALGIAAGAMGAHSLENILSERYLEVWETAWRYWMYNMLGIMFLAGFIDRTDKHNPLTISFYKLWGFLSWLWIGSGIFTGTLVLVALNEVLSTKLKILGAITPIGGTILMVTWLLGGIKLFRHQKSNESV